VSNFGRLTLKGELLLDISRSDAVEALHKHYPLRQVQFDIEGEMDKLTDNLFVAFVKVWSGEYVSRMDTMFTTKNGKVEVYGV